MNLFIANEYTNSLAKHELDIHIRRAMPIVRAFVAQRTPLANRWLNKMHCAPTDRRLNDTQTRLAFITAIGINLKVENTNCKHCNMLNVNYFEHAECCKKSRKRITIDGQVKYPTRSWPLHSDLQKLMADSWSKIPDVTITQFNPKLSDIFPLIEAHPPNPVPPVVINEEIVPIVELDPHLGLHVPFLPPFVAVAAPPAVIVEEIEEEMDPVVEIGAPIVPPVADIPVANIPAEVPHNNFPVREEGSEYADLLVTVTFEGDNARYAVDQTVASIHAKTNIKYTIDENNKYQSKLPAHGEHLKDLKHNKYFHEGKAIGYALDSMGGISNAATSLTNHLYAKSSELKPRRWDSDNMRCALKKQYLDTLSCILAKHRVLDYTYMGLPVREYVHQPLRFAHGGANNIHNVNNNRNRHNQVLAAH